MLEEDNKEPLSASIPGELEESKQLQLPYDNTPSGLVEVLIGRDGKLREYVRRIDHDLVVEALAQAAKRPINLVQ